MTLPEITWARPRGKQPPTYCAIVDTRDGCTRTYCRGTWSTTESVEIYDEPAARDRCKRCGGCLLALGLAELAAADAVDLRPVATVDVP